MNTNKSNPSAPIVSDTNLQLILNKHALVFRGLGKLKNRQVDLAIDNTLSSLHSRSDEYHFIYATKSKVRYKN